jgi:hypothetical protein
MLGKSLSSLTMFTSQLLRLLYSVNNHDSFAQFLQLWEEAAQ